MNRAIVAFVSGLIFALGLGVSGMTQPQKVIGFLDITGSWDPSLAFVMGGAVGVYAVLYRLITRRPQPILAPAFALPQKKGIDRPLIVGSVLFGAGWGLAGFCPGPGLVASVSGAAPPLIFSISMITGMLLFRGWEALRTPTAAADPLPGK